MSIFALPKTEAQMELEKVRNEMALLARQTADRMAVLQRQIDELSKRVAAFPQPLRPRWVRHSRPDWDTETLELPSIRRQVSQRLAAHHLKSIPSPLDPRVKRVTICMSGAEQFVNTYDQNDQMMVEYTGPFREVGLKVMTAAGQLEWETVVESA